MATQTQGPASLTAAQARPADNPRCLSCGGSGSWHYHGDESDDCPNCHGTGRMSNQQAWRHFLNLAIAAGDHSKAYDMVDALIGAQDGKGVAA